MEDEPYRERLGGSYVADPKTGAVTAVEGPAAKPEPQPAPADDQAEPKKKKGN